MDLAIQSNQLLPIENHSSGKYMDNKAYATLKRSMELAGDAMSLLQDRDFSIHMTRNYSRLPLEYKRWAVTALELSTLYSISQFC